MAPQQRTIGLFTLRLPPMSNLFEEAAKIWDSLSEPMRAGIMSAIIGALRISNSNDRRRWYKQLLEIGLCAALTYCVGKGGPAIGMSVDVAWVFGAVIGYKGTEWVKKQGEEWFNKKKGDQP